jgi:hypothetical protein
MKGLRSMRLIDKYHQKYLPQTLVRVRLRPLSYYVSLLRENRPFSFSRFGDGEWSAILSKPGENCDGHRFFPELGADLRAAIENGNGYFNGMQIRAVKAMGKEIRDFLRKHDSTIDWHDADVFHYANNAGTLFPLVQQLRTMKVVVVGPPHLRALSKSVFPYEGFIEIPLKNCYLDKENIYRKISDLREKSGSPTVYAFSASMTTNVLIHRLFPAMGATSWLIDFGSLWDVFVGVKSRSGYEKEDWSGRIRKNLGGR